MKDKSSALRDTSGRNSVQSVERAMALLYEMATSDTRLPLIELSRRLGCSPSTIHRLLTAMEKSGMVEKDLLTLRYGLGLKVLELARARGRQVDIRGKALPFLHELRDLTGETVGLQLLVGRGQVCIEQVESPQELRRSWNVGRASPLYPGATGRVFLAFFPDAVRQAALVDLRARADLRLPVPPDDDLQEELRQIRHQGYAVSAGELVVGAAAVSAPIFNQAGEVVAAITVSGPSDRFTTAQVAAWGYALRAAAQSVSIELGYQDDSAEAATTERLPSPC